MKDMHTRQTAMRRLIADATEDEELMEACDTLGEAFHRHISPPTAMATGFSALAHKCSCISHQWCLDTSPDLPLDEFADSFVSSTSDMGTESLII